MRNPHELGRILRYHFGELGFDAAEARLVDPTPVLWSRPPLFTELMLSGRDVQEYLRVTTPLAVDTMADLYERFIAMYLYRRPKPTSDRWWRRQLGWGGTQTSALFSRPGFNQEGLGRHVNLIEFAAFVAYNFKVYTRHAHNTFEVVDARLGFRFGVEEGRLITNLGVQRRGIPVRGLEAWPRLVGIQRGELAEAAEGNLYDVLWRWLQPRRRRLGAMADAMCVCLQALRWSHPRRVPGTLRLVASPETSRAALQDACDRARGYGQFDNPITKLKELFHPHFLTRTEFAGLFGSPYQRVATPLPDKVRQKWDQAIDSLDPGHQGDYFDGEGPGEGAGRAEEAGRQEARGAEGRAGAHA